MSQCFIENSSQRERIYQSSMSQCFIETALALQIVSYLDRHMRTLPTNEQINMNNNRSTIKMLRRKRFVNSSPVIVTLLLILLTSSATRCCNSFEFQEATVADMQRAFKNGSLTSRQLVEYYLDRIEELNPLLHAVIEVNPDALRQADRADGERRSACRRGHRGPKGLHGIPVLLKDLIGTKDRLNTTAGSLALLRSIVPRDAGVVRRLRQAGAVILGKANMIEWANRTPKNSSLEGWSARGGQGRNPYVLWANPCGSSTGSAIAAAANMAAVTLGTDTDGSILCPAAYNSVVGIRPTVGLTSRAGVIPISPRQDSIGPICRSVSDAVEVLEAIVGYDPLDASATKSSSKYIPQGGFKQFLKLDGLKGKRIGIVKDFFIYPNGSIEQTVFEEHFKTMRKNGAALVEDVQIANISIILDPTKSGELVAVFAEFKMALNSYLSKLSHSPVNSLAEVIEFNNKHVEEKTDEYGQDFLLLAQNTSGIGATERDAIAKMNQLSKAGIEKLMMEKRLDAVMAPDVKASSILAIGGYPAISVPAGYDASGKPFGIWFGGLKGSEPKLIAIAYAFEQATKVRKPPTFINNRIK